MKICEPSSAVEQGKYVDFHFIKKNLFSVMVSHDHSYLVPQLLHNLS
jgi:hypothetical protein